MQDISIIKTAFLGSYAGRPQPVDLLTRSPLYLIILRK